MKDFYYVKPSTENLKSLEGFSLFLENVLAIKELGV